jgi:sugar/nucleoside kinase (ribokinase family)
LSKHGEPKLRFDLVGVGNPVYDTIITQAIKSDGRVLSGCSTNACLAAKKLGMDHVGLVGCVGKDFADRFRVDMKQYGISVNFDSNSLETGGFHLIYDKTGDRTLDVLGVARKITPADFPEAFLESKFILVGPILGEVDLGLVEFIKTSSSAKVFLDPQGLIRTIGPDKRVVHKCDEESFGKIAELVDFVKPNQPESVTITGKTDPFEALQRLSTMSRGVPIVTLAERGSLLLESGIVHRIPAFGTNAIDPTGAGDVYAGSFIVEFDRTGSLVEAALFASAAASIMVEQVGPDFKMSRKEVEARRDVLRSNLVNGVVH